MLLVSQVEPFKRRKLRPEEASWLNLDLPFLRVILIHYLRRRWQTLSEPFNLRRLINIGQIAMLFWTNNDLKVKLKSDFSSSQNS